MTQVRKFSSVDNIGKAISNAASGSIFSKHEFSPIKSITRIPCKSAAIPAYDPSEKFVIAKRRDLKERIRKMKRDGRENLLLITDFDQTLTKSFHENRKPRSSFESLQEFLLPESITEIENFHRQSRTEIKQKMLTFKYKLLFKEKKIALEIEHLIKAKINLNHLSKMSPEYSIVPRAKIDSLLKLYHDYKIPFYILSAGVSNIIASMLAEHINLNECDNMHLCSNEMVFDDKGLLVDFRKPYIHLYMKSTILQREGTVRKNVIILGDLLTDTHLSVNMKPMSLLTIGYLNFGVALENLEGLVGQYAKRYDIVLGPDASLALPELLTRYMLDLESEDTIFRYLDENVWGEEEAERSLVSMVRKSGLARKEF